MQQPRFFLTTRSKLVEKRWTSSICYLRPLSDQIPIRSENGRMWIMFKWLYQLAGWHWSTTIWVSSVSDTDQLWFVSPCSDFRFHLGTISENRGTGMVKTLNFFIPDPYTNATQCFFQELHNRRQYLAIGQYILAHSSWGKPLLARLLNIK